MNTPALSGRYRHGMHDPHLVHCATATLWCAQATPRRNFGRPLGNDSRKAAGDSLDDPARLIADEPAGSPDRSSTPRAVPAPGLMICQLR